MERCSVKELKERSARNCCKKTYSKLLLVWDQTPAVVERIVDDIDAIVKQVRYPGWQTGSQGERLVQQGLRKILWVKYKIKDQDLFDRAYAYIKEYY